MEIPADQDGSVGATEIRRQIPHHGFRVADHCPLAVYKWIRETRPLTPWLSAIFPQAAVAPKPYAVVLFEHDPAGGYVLGLDCPRIPLVAASIFFESEAARDRFEDTVRAAGFRYALSPW
jgi:hypothetical protein